MKLLGVLMLCTLAVAALPNAIQKIDIGLDIPDEALATGESRNFLINKLICQMFTYIRYIIKNGSSIFGFPPLDPLVLSDFRIYLPWGYVNLDLDLKNGVMNGIGDFIVQTSNFVPSQMSLELDISVPSVEIKADVYDLVGDFLTAIPLYGKGSARFQMDGFRFRGTLILRQSEDGKSVIIDKIINSSYQIPYFKSDLTGVIGGGEIDQVVNAIIEDVVIDYANRFQGAIAALVSTALPVAANPLLENLDTWRYIERFV